MCGSESWQLARCSRRAIAPKSPELLVWRHDPQTPSPVIFWTSIAPRGPTLTSGRGYKLVALKTVTPSKELAQEHYADLSSRPFFPGLVSYITSGVPVVAMVWEGKDVIKQGRRIVGATNPLDADPGSVRGQYAVSVGRNLIHASDSFDSATKEIGLWFKEQELSNYETAAWGWIMADN